MTETGRLRCGSGGAATAGTLGTAAVELDSGHEGGGASGHEGEGRMQSVFLANPPPPPGLYRAILGSRRVHFLCLLATPSEFGHFGLPAVHKKF